MLKQTRAGAGDPPQKGKEMGTNNERLKKIKELALRGVGGEREQAIALLEKLSKKYNIDCTDLDEEKIQEFFITFHGDIESRLLHQIVYKVTNEKNRTFSARYTDSGRKCGTKIIVECTEAQKTEIEFLFDFYKRLWKKDIKTLLTAFIQQHKLFGELKEGEEGTILPPDELLKIQLMSQGLTDETPLKQITDGKK